MDIPPEHKFDDPADKWDAWQQEAMLVFNFDEGDLAMNRRGELSDKQKHRLMVNRNTGTIVMASVGLVFAIVFLVADSKSHSPHWWFAVGAFVVFGLIAMVLFWIGSRSFRRGMVHSVTGMITFRGGPRIDAMQIDGEGFPYLPSYERLFLPGVVYTIYFAPTDRPIMSVEIVRQ
jgi:hypothetical protein